MSQARTYFSKVTGSRFIFPDGHDCHFIGGRYTTTDPEEIKILDGRLGKSTMIYSQDSLKTAPLPEVKQNALSEQELAEKERAVATSGVSVKTSQEVGPVSPVPAQASDVNVSTVDPALQAQVFTAQADNAQVAAARASAAIAAAKSGGGK